MVKNPIIFLFFLPMACCGQSNYFYPSPFSAYFQNKAQITPAYIPENAKAEFTSGYKSMTGAFRKVSNFYVTGSRTFTSKKNQLHLLRLQFYNEKEGSYITNPRAYANYAYQLALSDQVNIYSGVAVGIIGMYYSAPTTTQASYTVPDGGLGLGIKSAWFDIGGSILQVPNSGYKPVKSTVLFHRYYNAYFSLKKTWETEWGVKILGLWRHLPSLGQEYWITGSLFYSHLMELGTTYSPNQGIAIFTIIGIDGETDKLGILLNYTSPILANTPKWQSNLEIGLAYTVK